jgi:hypothetical protein
MALKTTVFAYVPNAAGHLRADGEATTPGVVAGDIL